MSARSVIVLTLLASALLAACGGGGEGTPSATETPAGMATPAGTAVAQPTPQAVYQSFRYAVRLDIVLDSQGVQFSLSRAAEGFFAAPDSHAYRGFVGTAGQAPQHDVVVIGDEGWYREGGGPWAPQTRAALLASGVSSLTTLQPGFLNDGTLAQRFAGLEGTPDDFEGVAATKYTITLDDISAIAPLLGHALIADLSGIEELDASVWVDQATGALVRLQLTGRATPAGVLGAAAPAEVPPDSRFDIGLTVEVTRVNDPSIKISPPI